MKKIITTYEITSKDGKVTFYKKSLDEVLAFFSDKENKLKNFNIYEVKKKEISESLTMMLKSDKDMAEIRKSSFDGEAFDSGYMKDDHSLKYTFDLCHDIKTLGQLAREFREGASIDLENLALSYGFTSDYLSSIKLIDRSY